MGPTQSTPEAEIDAAIEVLETNYGPGGRPVESALYHLRRAQSLLRGEVSQPEMENE